MAAIRRPQLALVGLAFSLALGIASPPPAAAGTAQVFDVTDYGAIPNDNLTDHHAGRAAVEAAAAAGGGIVHFPCGRYRSGPSFWDSVVRINSGENDIWIRGERSGCVTFEPHWAISDGVALASICNTNRNFSCNEGYPPPENIWVSGIRFYDYDPISHAGNEETHGLIASCKGCRFFDIQMDYMGDEAFDITESQNVRIEGTRCLSPGLVGGGKGNGGACFNVQSSSDVRIIDGTCRDGATASHQLSACVRAESHHPTIPISNLQVERLTVRNFRGTPVHISTSALEIDGVTIRDSWLESTTGRRLAIESIGDHFLTGLRISDNRLVGSLRFQHVDAPVIDRNFISAANGHGIELLRTYDAQISDNVIQDFPKECILMTSGAAVRIAGNRCLGTGSAGRAVIKVNANYFKDGPVDILDNFIDAHSGSTVGIDLRNFPDPAVAIRGNTVRNTGGRGIFAMGQIVGNKVIDTGAEGIYLESDKADGALVLDNHVDDAAGACVRASNTSSVRISRNTLRRCSQSAGAIYLTAINGNQQTNVEFNDTDAKIVADGPASICIGNRAAGKVNCGGPESIIIGNMVPVESTVEGDGAGSQKLGNLE